MLSSPSTLAPTVGTAFSTHHQQTAYSPACESPYVPASQPYATGFDEPTSGRVDGPVPVGRIIRSVVEEAGLGRFIYLAGRSGDRYVFSSIEGRQAAMYRGALFAVIDDQGQPIMLSTRASDVVSTTNRIYVHLLKEDGPDAEAVISDLKRFSS